MTAQSVKEAKNKQTNKDKNRKKKKNPSFLRLVDFMSANDNLKKTANFTCLWKRDYGDLRCTSSRCSSYGSNYL